MDHGPIERLIEYLEVQRVDRFLFTGKSPARPSRIFGGQVLAQSLNAALRSVDAAFEAHSMHAYFLRPGDPSRQIVFEVDPIRDGRSFATRRVVAKQDGRAIFNTAISFQRCEPGLEHQASPVKVTPPEALESDFDFWTRKHAENPERYPAPLAQAIERRVVNRRDYDNPQPQEAVQHSWFRVSGDVGEDPHRHQVLLAFMSDFALLGASLLPHPYTAQSPGMQVASLDHALWFHRPARADEYLLYAMDSPNASGGRGFCRGQFFTRDGQLVASTAQEALIRRREA
ncbi:acyl-CoA thioesterase [Pseudohaliea rubra]|uniref:Acyl-CoA thioesterase 2 n=1 Tax=Pseudohaliea rubra DSM 19751 TaxID=1265313 RepID=A0A095XYD2_9GAMM|nr:acyl-CoA thioesterase II [Pseudohaliea rubra]KGE04771.1 Acyl-CoA thioesterase II [Pseudohaliea rubra DSM 19751]